MTESPNNTPTMAKVLQDHIKGVLKDIHTCMPAEVQSYDTTTNSVDVQPNFKRTYTDGDTVDLPIIRSVPVAFPRAGTAGITFPIKRGDSVLLIFSERSLDKWKNTGGTITPDDPRTHDLSDAIAIPGIYPQSNPLPIDPDNLVVRNLTAKATFEPSGNVTIEGGISKIAMDKTGKIAIGNGTIELLDLIDQVIDGIQALTVATAVGPSSVPINLATFAALKLQLAFIKA